MSTPRDDRGGGGDRGGSNRGRGGRNYPVKLEPTDPRSRGSGVTGANAEPVGSPASTTARNFDDLTLERPTESGTVNGNTGGNGAGANGDGTNGDSGERPARRPGYERAEGERRGPRLADYDIVRSKPEGAGKQGGCGQKVNLFANYFEIRRSADWSLYQHRVDFEPEVELTRTKKILLRKQGEKLGAYIFDGTLVYTSTPLCDEGSVMELKSEWETKEKVKEMYTIKIKLVSKVDPETPMYISFYNLVVRKCQEGLNMALMGRHYFDKKAAINMSNQRLELWPGFITVLRQHERNLLMCVEITHKVVRLDDVMNIMEQKRQEVRGRGGGKNEVKQAVKEELVGTIILTSYNATTYRVDDILWDEKPTDSFETRKGPITFMEYYKNKYDITIKKPNQPLIASNPKKKDIRRGQKEIIKLIPELCQMTGLTDGMRQNFRLMKDLGQHLFQPPQKKLEGVAGFVNRLRATPEIVKELESWGLSIVGKPSPVAGRLLPNEKIMFNDGRGPKPIDTDAKADWTMAFRSSKMTTTKALENWVIIVPQRDAQNVDNLLRTMQNVSRPIGFSISHPTDVVRVPNISPEGYSQVVTDVMNRHGENVQLVFVILANNRLEAYAAVKKRCNLDYGVPSQCFLAKNMTNPKGLMSIATKVVIQMNAKLGGEPWNLQIPLRKMMVVGFDVYHGGAKVGGGGGGGRTSISAMVCTTSASYGRYFSTLSFHENRDEVSTKIAGDLTKCLLAWAKVNNGLPERVLFYRDGVGEGQLQQVYSVELEAIKRRIQEIYRDASTDEAKLTYIVVTKRINTRFFLQNRSGFENPLPGTVVDDVVTWPERWDFYLIAQLARQGTVSPTSYNILYERNGLDADKIQRLSYKLCHGYYNWSGTVAVPAPCQYAHKLAYLTGLATKSEAHPNLAHYLYFL